MFKELKNTDSQNLKAYVEFDTVKLEDTRAYSAMFFNIVVCLLGAFYINSAVAVKIVEVVFILICAVFMLWFKFKVSKTQANIMFYYAGFMCAMSVNLCFVSCLFFSTSEVGFLIPAVIFVVLVPVIAFATMKKESRKIIKGSYLNQTSGKSPLLAGACVAGAGLGIFLSRLLGDELGEGILLGFCCGFLGLILAMVAFYFVKGYCHWLVEKIETE
ncbi:MAG: hypothetical protein IKJ69_03925 [Clostridia bacterium]|nr:hypothetical protein [Clostridia bacterium]